MVYMAPPTGNKWVLYDGAATNYGFFNEDAGRFDLLFAKATGAATFAATTSGTSTTAAAVLAKSLGLTENLWVGGTLNVAGATTIGGTGTEISGAGYLRATSGFAKTDTTLRNIAAFSTNEAAGSSYKLLVSVTGNATAASRIFDLQTSNEGVSNSGVLRLQNLGGSTTVNGIFTSTDTTEATTGGAGSLTTAGGIYAAKKIITATGITTGDTATFHTTSAALTNGAGASLGTLTNAPAVGNPTKWIGINDKGTTRYIPAW
jgi:hypothetical protein